MSNVTIYTINKHIQLLVILAALFCVFSFVLYGYFLQSTIFYSSIVEDGESRFASLSSSSGELEKTYLSLKSEITLEKAHAFGLIDGKDALYISRGVDTALSLNKLP